MERTIVECLNCGQVRAVVLPARLALADECPRCGYLGWADHSDLTEDARRLLRERPLEQRRIAAA